MAHEKSGVEAIHEMLQKHAALELQTCVQVIEQALNKYGCQIIGVPVLTPDGRIETNVQIIKKP